jgi:cytochrome b subunit of formate dehydrogenase
VQQIKTCGGCHGEPPELIGNYLGSVHGKALLVAGLTVAPSCSDCHGSHTIQPPSHAESKVSHAKVPATCGSCHELILEQWRGQSAHGAGWQAGRAETPVCVTCHTAHAIGHPTSDQARLKAPTDCGTCHGERYSTYRDSFHGKATELGFLTAATCADCHTPHQNLPASDPRSSVHPDRLLDTCGRCHEGIRAAFVSFDPHSDPTVSGRQPWVHRVYLAMTALLIGVFGFFGLHDLLWLQRSVVALARRERGYEATEGPWVSRFSRTQVAVHAIVIVTFLTLAATGLPLKFHASAWVRPLASLMGGIGTTRVLHRLAAVLTFGYFGFHVASLLYRGLVKKEKGLLWGWRSMVPRGKDLRDLWAHMRWFLYVGRRPQLDRWAYWEKFDYFAVFWGVVIIGLSGLMLWLPGLFTRFLPGWMLNVAYVVHSDEALLAVGFIFVFHFFHTHLRPEAFPLDPVIFTGAMPLERLQQERPLEYQRLVARGELEARLVPPPSARRLRAAYVVGGTALLVGMLLVLGILWSLLAH